MLQNEQMLSASHSTTCGMISMPVISDVGMGELLSLYEIGSGAERLLNSQIMVCPISEEETWHHEGVGLKTFLVFCKY